MNQFDLYIAALERVARCQSRAGDLYAACGQMSEASRAYRIAWRARHTIDRLT